MMISKIKLEGTPVTLKSFLTHLFPIHPFSTPWKHRTNGLDGGKWGFLLFYGLAVILEVKIAA